ncbi:hypothetical protein L484_022295 [Morus notabilis]|uniref:Uncharacterized protein n=1 Tax=Morus notabilis TaxID=981085 RepID=W9SGU7_9ROSA|nr:hypothetical protein L484_022295 [Morus notabilis]
MAEIQGVCDTAVSVFANWQPLRGFDCFVTRLIGGGFREKIELLSSPLREADVEFLMGAFSNGLAEEIKAEVRMVKACLSCPTDGLGPKSLGKELGP